MKSESDSDPVPFSELGLSSAALEALADVGFERPTPIQAQAIPPALAGRDVIACAATGTGKTAAFVLPILERVAGRRGTRALVLSPTRELAGQIADCFRALGRRRRVSVATIVGGVGFEPQVRAMRSGSNVIVATPGRLVDLIERGHADFGGLEFVVLDEADRMLDMGFRRQLDAILRELPRRRQSMLFSATMGNEVRQFSRACLDRPVRVEIAKSGTVAARARQQVFHVDEKGKPALLLALLRQSDTRTLVFTRTKHRANRVAKRLDREGLAVGRIHGNRSQSQRTSALERFRSGEIQVLVATDVAARGIDVEEIGHVVNYDLSFVPDDHVHRVGRTARADAEGVASSFCSPDERELLTAIQRFTRTEIPAGRAPEGVHVAPPPRVASDRRASDRPSSRSSRKAQEGQKARTGRRSTSSGRRRKTEAGKAGKAGKTGHTVKAGPTGRAGTAVNGSPGPRSSESKRPPRRRRRRSER